MKKSITIMMLVMAMPLFAGDKIYQTTDEHGNVIYTDQPSKKSREVDLPPATTYKPLPYPPALTSPADKQQQATEFSGYKSVRITSPTNEQTFIHAQANAITVNAISDPGLQKDHHFQLMINNTVNQQGLQLPILGQGAHTVIVNIVDDDGEVLASSEPVTFYVLRPRKR